MAKSTKLSMLVLLMVISGCMGEGFQVIRVIRGEEVILPCTLKTPISQSSWFDVRWRKWTKGRSKNVVVSDSEVQGQASNLNGNLTLKEADKAQEGDYTCEVCDGFICDFTTNFTLKLKDCNILDSVEALPFSEAILPCPFYTTRGNISWSEIKGGEPMKPILEFPSLSRESSLNSITAQNGKGRFLNITAGDASLVITYRETSNIWFRCTVYEGQKNKCSDVNLQVKKKDQLSTSTSSTLTTMVTTAQGLFPTATDTSATTSRETVVHVQTVVESSSWNVMLVVLSVALITTIALIVGLYRWKTTGHTAPDSTWQNPHYEIAEVPVSGQSEINEAYEYMPFYQEESMCTFIYE